MDPANIPYNTEAFHVEVATVVDPSIVFAGMVDEVMETQEKTMNDLTQFSGTECTA